MESHQATVSFVTAQTSWLAVLEFAAPVFQELTGRWVALVRLPAGRTRVLVGLAIVGRPRILLSPM
jgi:hypothetical protein